MLVKYLIVFPWDADKDKLIRVLKNVNAIARGIQPELDALGYQDEIVDADAFHSNPTTTTVEPPSTTTLEKLKGAGSEAKAGAEAVGDYEEEGESQPRRGGGKLFIVGLCVLPLLVAFGGAVYMNVGGIGDTLRGLLGMGATNPETPMVEMQTK